MSERLNHLYAESLRVGLTDALDAMTLELRQTYAEQIATFSASLQKATTEAKRSTTYREAILRFVERLGAVIPEMPREYGACIVHSSAVAVDDEIFDVFKNEARAKEIYDKPVGSILYEFCVAECLFNAGVVTRRGVAFANAAIRFVKRARLVNSFWIDRQLGPVIGTDVGRDERAVENSYFRLLTAIADRDGVSAARKFVERTIDPLAAVNKFEGEIIEGDPKTLLQEYLQSVRANPPKYDVSRVAGTSDHEPLFAAEVRVPKIGVVTATGGSKAEASMRAAEAAVERLARSQETKPALQKYLGRRSAESVGDRKGEFDPIPDAVFELLLELKKERGIGASPRHLGRALVSPDLRKGRFQGLRGNEELSFMGSMLIEVVIENCHARSSHRSPHPVIVDQLASDLRIVDYQAKIFGREPFHGRDRVHDAAQAVLFAIYLHDANVCRDWLRKTYVLVLDGHPLSPDKGPAASWQVAPAKFDPKFSYVTALQEFTQSVDKSVPLYSDIKDMKFPHDPTHQSIVTWGGKQARGNGKRVSWSRNEAAYRLLFVLKSEIR